MVKCTVMHSTTGAMSGKHDEQLLKQCSCKKPLLQQLEAVVVAVGIAADLLMLRVQMSPDNIFVPDTLPATVQTVSVVKKLTWAVVGHLHL